MNMQSIFSNKGIIIAGIVVLVVIGGGLFVANQQSQKSEQAKMAQEKVAMAEKEAMKAKENAVMEEKKVMEKKNDFSTGSEQDKMMKKDSTSRYVVYSKTALDQAATNRRVLYFYANWCPICKPADADFRANSSKIPADVTVIRVNYNDTDTDQEEKDLAKKYGITYQHTFVQIDGQGKEVTKWNGGKTDELLANIK
jgi:thiol-disulfide isomerase/thioredoxin